uniref:Glutaredoxin domain-containing protein n=1 Tax=Noccaea caerulescens TaxID=107243 RepID=A0A1J3FG54_NOCCA
MGCASSKHRKRCVHCRRGYSPVDMPPRSQSVHHPPQHSEDSCHMVALSSSSLGSLKLCDSSFGHNHKHLADFTGKLTADESGEKQIAGHRARPDNEKLNLEMQAKLMEAKVWSSMMNEKIPKIVPKTPIVTPPGEPETINTWEMMDGLEDMVSPLRSPNHVRSFSFDVSRNGGDCEPPKPMFQENGHVKPVWLQMEEEGLDSSCRFEDFDPEIISSFRKSLQELPSDHPFHISIHDLKLNPQFNLFQVEEEEEKEETLGENIGKEKVILYFTSLRGIRKTYEESCDVRVILKSLGIRVDERDVSMHSGFKEELKELLGDRFNNGVGITLPRVFLGRKYLGGAEEIRKLNEDGKLEKLLQGCERVEENKNGNGQECEGCGDVRFVPCETCSGSCKVYYEEEDDEEEDDDDDQSVKEEREYGFQTCPDCNENGLIRCPLCCD